MTSDWTIPYTDVKFGPAIVMEAIGAVFICLAIYVLWGADMALGVILAYTGLLFIANGREAANV